MNTSSSKTIHVADGAGLERAVAEAGVSRRERVTIACDEVFGQTVVLRRAQVDGLSEDELKSLLFYEIEPFTTLSREAGVVGHSPARFGADGSASFEVVHVPTELMERAARAVRDAGGVFCGISNGQDAVAVPAPPPKLSERPMRLCAYVCAAVAAVCAIDFAVLSCAVRHDRPVERTLRQADGRRAAVVAEISSAESEISRLQGERKARAAVRERLSKSRKAWPSLLSALAAECRDDAVVTRISCASPYSADVLAMSLDQRKAADFLSRISTSLASVGWSVSAAPEINAADGMVNFKFHVEASF